MGGNSLRGADHPSQNTTLVNGGCHAPFQLLPAFSRATHHRTRDRGMRQQSPVAVGDTESGIGGCAELSQRPSSVHGHRRFQQTTVTRATHEQRCDLVYRIKQWHVRGKHKPGDYRGPERVGAMRARIHGEGYDSRGNGVFIDESRRWIAAQNLRSRPLDVPVNVISFLPKNRDFTSNSQLVES